MQDEWKPAEWVLAAIIVGRLVHVTRDDADFIRDEILKLLRSGKIRSRDAITGMPIPATYWHDVSLSKTGAATIPVDAAIGLHYDRHPIELRLSDVLECWADQAGDILTPEPEPVPEPEPARGLGRPLKRHLFMPAFDRRHDAGERYRTLSEWGRVLAKDVQANKNTIRNYLSNHLLDSQKKDL